MYILFKDCYSNMIVCYLVYGQTYLFTKQIMTIMITANTILPITAPITTLTENKELNKKK